MKSRVTWVANRPVVLRPHAADARPVSQVAAIFVSRQRARSCARVRVTLILLHNGPSAREQPCWQFGCAKAKPKPLTCFFYREKVEVLDFNEKNLYAEVAKI